MASVDELWLIDFGEPYPGKPAAHRPALVIGPPNTFGQAFPFAIVAPLTTTRRDLSLHIEIEPVRATGLDDVSYVQCELIRSVNRNRLIHRMGTIDKPSSAQVADVLRVLLDL